MIPAGHLSGSDTHCPKEMMRTFQKIKILTDYIHFNSRNVACLLNDLVLRTDFFFKQNDKKYVKSHFNF